MAAVLPLSSQQPDFLFFQVYIELPAFKKRLPQKWWLVRFCCKMDADMQIAFVDRTQSCSGDIVFKTAA